jgi:hypothetical protein
LSVSFRAPLMIKAEGNTYAELVPLTGNI